MTHVMSTAADRDRQAAALARAAEQYASLGHMDAAARALRSACELRPAPAPARTAVSQEDADAAFAQYLADRFC